MYQVVSIPSKFKRVGNRNLKWKVDMYVGGQTFPEYCYAVNRQDAIDTAVARNPKARVIGTNVVFTSTFQVGENK